MTKSVFFVAFAISIGFASCATQEQTADKKNITTTNSTTTVEISSTKPGPLSSTLKAYYQLKDAFVKTDGTDADMTAMQLRLSVDSLDAEKLEVDSLYAPGINGYKKVMLLTIDSLIKERNMEKKRMQFATLSDNLYNLLKTTPYKGETVYRVHCPMAFDKGANWLNNQPVVANPYFGNKMLDCGEVTDSLVEK